MKYFKAKFIIPVSIVVVLLLVAIICYFKSNGTSDYYIVANNADMVESTPVLMENISVGTVKSVERNFGNKGRSLIKFELDKEYSIPSNSKVEILSGRNFVQKQIRIIVLASKDYLKPGDTIFIPGEKLEKENFETGHGSLIYRIQVFVSTEEMSAKATVFKGIPDIEIIRDGKAFKYYTGELKKLADAKRMREKVVELGVKDAFIVPFLNDQRISLDQAIKFEK